MIAKDVPTSELAVPKLATGGWRTMLFAPINLTVPQWRYLPLWLVVAFVLRAYIALAGNFILHPDEVMQYLEPAHRLVFGYGIVAWEFHYGARSWLVPGFIAGILLALDQLGFGNPGVYVYVVKLVFCLLALLIPWGIYHYARHIVAEQVARLALVLACLWPYLIVFAHKPMTEFVATNLLCAALGFLSLPISQSRRGAFALGAILALVAAVRMQYLPIAGLVWLARALPMDRIWIATSVTGGLLMLALVGLLETFTWGIPFHSYYYNLVYNIQYNSSPTPLSWYYYLPRLLFATAGGLIIMLWSCGRQLQRYLLLLVVLLTVILIHSLQDHKEFRFIFVALTLWLIPCCGQLYEWARTISHKLLLRWIGAMTAIFSFLVIGNFINDQWLYYQEKNTPIGNLRYVWQQENNMIELYLDLAKDQNVKGLLHLSESYFFTPGYYHLHHQVPFYDAGAYSQISQKGIEPTRLATHVITVWNIPFPDFVPLPSMGIYVAGQARTPSEVIAWENYSPHSLNKKSIAITDRLFGTAKRPPPTQLKEY